MTYLDGTPAFTVQNRGQPDNVVPRFYMKPVQNNFRSEAEGRPMFDEEEFVEIRVPGDRGSMVDTLVRPEHKARWPQYYRAFKDQLEAPTEGTPLEEWPKITRAQAEEMRYFHVKTVEQFAGLSDDQLTKVMPMGGFPLRDAAKRFLEAAAGAAPAEKLAAENAAKDAKIASLEDTVKDLARRLDEMSAQRASAPVLPPEVA